MNNYDLFIKWNSVLFDYFFNNNDDEVTLYIDRETIEKVGSNNGLGGYDEFLRIIMLSIEDRAVIFRRIYKSKNGTPPTKVNRRLQNINLFKFASLFVSDFPNAYFDYPPFFIYIVFAVVMGSECYRDNQNGIGNYITNILQGQFPNHPNNRDGLGTIFKALAKQDPRFRALKLTDQPYIGLIKYQLGLSKSQETILNRAMYNAGLSEELSYDQWIDNLVDYVDQNMKSFLRDSKRNEVLKRRISDLRDRFDYTQYEQNHSDEEIQSKGHFVLAVYEDEYSASNDRLVLLTDINNKCISKDNLKIAKGSLDRLGEYAEYNVNHVLIGDNDKAEMKSYSLKDGENEIRSLPFENGCIVTFSRCNSNYLIQTSYPQQEKETYILVKSGHDDDWNQWQVAHGSPFIEAAPNKAWVRQVFGEGWEMYKSNQIEYVNNRQTAAHVTAITMGGGINCPGKTNVYLITALPYFEFPEPIDGNRLRINIDVDQRPLNENQFSYKIVDSYKLVIDLIGINPCNRSLCVDVSITHKEKPYQEQFDVTGQEVKYNEDDLFMMNMWGQKIDNNIAGPYMKGLKLCNNTCQLNLPQETVLYQPQYQTNAGLQLIDPQDRRFYLINLFAANCSMHNGFLITESRLKKCIRYAVTRLEIDTASISSFYRDLRFLLINSGYMNVDYEHGKYQPVPPTFVKTPARLYRNDHLYLLAGSYTYQFLVDLVNYCRANRVNMFLHESNPQNSPAESLMPPVILLQYNFDPEHFRKCTNSNFQFYGDTAIAVNILNALPSYQQYRETLREISPEVFDRRNLKEPPEDNTLPRIRESKTIGYGAQKWIEKSVGRFYSIAIPDLSWAKLYCFYEKKKAICIKDNRNLLFPTDLHLPSMMQRALFITNFGIPLRKKVFICNKTDSNNKYFNIVKQYNVKSDDQKRCTFKALTGQNDDQNNVFLRDVVRCPNYRLEMWTNKNKCSDNPRSLLVLIYKESDEVLGFAIKNKGEFKIFFLKELNHGFNCVNDNDVNTVFSKFMTSEKGKTWAEMGVSFVDNKHVSLPPREEYEKEEISII